MGHAQELWLQSAWERQGVAWKRQGTTSHTARAGEGRLPGGRGAGLQQGEAVGEGIPGAHRHGQRPRDGERSP